MTPNRSLGTELDAGPAEVSFLAPEDLQPLTLTAEEAAMMASIQSRIVARESTEAILGFLAAHTRAVLPGDRLSVAFVEDEGERLTTYCTVADYSPLSLDRGYSEALRDSSLERLLARGEVRIIGDLERYLEKHPASRSTRALVKEGLRSSLTCPLRVEDRVVGVFFRSSRVPRAFSERHAALEVALAERLGPAVEKTHLLERLRATNHAYSEVLAFVTHELKSPVASMVAMADLLHDGYVGSVTEAQREKLARIAAKGHYLLDLVRDYLELARIEGGNVPYAPVADVDLARDVLALALDVVRGAATERGVEMEVDSRAHRVHADPSLLRIVMVNLLSNAVKYGREGGRIRVTTELDPSALRLTVWNSGPGFPESERARLFRKFSRLHAPDLQRAKGSGVGLYTVHRLVSLHGGAVTARSEPGAWAEFSVTLPQPPRRATAEAAPEPDAQ